MIFIELSVTIMTFEQGFIDTESKSLWPGYKRGSFVLQLSDVLTISFVSSENRQARQQETQATLNFTHSQKSLLPPRSTLPDDKRIQLLLCIVISQLLLMQPVYSFLFVNKQLQIGILTEK